MVLKEYGRSNLPESWTLNQIDKWRDKSHSAEV